MIQKAQESDSARIRTYLNRFYTPAYVRLWMNQHFQPKDTYLLSEENGLEGILVARHHAMTLLSERIGYTFLSHFHCDSVQSRTAQKMIDEVLDDLSYQDLLVLAEPDENGLLQKKGFVPFVTRRFYELNRSERRSPDVTGISDNYSDTELKKVYDRYTAYFDGAMLRDEQYFRQRQEAMKTSGLKCIVYRNRSNESEGYAVFDPLSYPMNVTEVVYLNSLALERMIGYLLNYKDSVRFCLSPQENISRIWPDADWWDKCTILAKITDTQLFNRLFNTDISQSGQLTEKIKRPLFHNEVF